MHLDIIIPVAFLCAGVFLGWFLNVKNGQNRISSAKEAAKKVLLDAEKEVYSDCYELIVPRLVKGGLLVADNATSHGEALAPMLQHALNDERVDALIVPIGKGELVCRKV